MADKVTSLGWFVKTIIDQETFAQVQEWRRETQPQSIYPGVSLTPGINTVLRFSCNATGIAARTIIITIADPKQPKNTWTTTVTLAGGETRALVNSAIATALIANSAIYTGSNTQIVKLATSNFSAPTGGTPSTMDLTYAPTWRSYLGGLPENPTVTIGGTYGSCTVTTTTPGLQAIITTVERQDISKNTAWEIHTIAPTTMVGRNEYMEAEISFPALIFAIDLSVVTSLPDSNGNSSHPFRVNYTQRPARRRVVTLRGAVSYGTQEITPPTLFNFETTSLIFDGVLFSLNERDVFINDFSGANELEALIGADDITWPTPFIETYSQGPTTPSATGYLSLIGTEVIKSFRSEKWKYSMWRNIVFYLTLQ